jgi:hypothetical protein
MNRATIRQRKTGQPIWFEFIDQTRLAAYDYMRSTGQAGSSLASPGEAIGAGYDGQYARLVQDWAAGTSLDPAKFGTNLSVGRKRVDSQANGNLRAV